MLKLERNMSEALGMCSGYCGNLPQLGDNLPPTGPPMDDPTHTPMKNQSLEETRGWGGKCDWGRAHPQVGGWESGG